MPLPSQVVAIQPQLLREEVYLSLKRWIVDGTLVPGERVRDTELAERLGVSRMPVREALNRLADEGFVETAANRWTRVALLDPDEARRIYPIVWSLERLAVGLGGPRLGKAELNAMAAANARLRDAIDRGDPLEASRADNNFHEVYIEAADNPELARILASLKVKLRRLEAAYFGGSLTASRSVEEHEDLLAALSAGEFERAADAVRDNWQRSFDRILGRLEDAVTTNQRSDQETARRPR
ncbi:MAG TPA: GntR family transcriptional regulator [Candidatus Binatia bacterium]|nr:GntR family transcriptional regulator [Candidatus Binatia bacterium]